MKLKEYQKFVKTLQKFFENREKEILTWGLGVSGEAGDIAGCIKKTISHGNDQTAGIKENIGDVMWYLAAICNFYGWDLAKVLDENFKKLTKRYPTGHFTEKDASRGNTRKDWNEDEP